MLLFSCNKSSTDQEQQAILYPNEDAPLAVLMREMYEDMEEILLSTSNHEDIKGYVEKHRNLLTATPTKPEVQNEIFALMGESYLYQLQELEKSESEEEVIKGYKALVENCLACHKQFCPGPIKRIEKLKK